MTVCTYLLDDPVCTYLLDDTVCTYLLYDTVCTYLLDDTVCTYLLDDTVCTYLLDDTVSHPRVFKHNIYRTGKYKFKFCPNYSPCVYKCNSQQITCCMVRLRKGKLV